MLVLRMILVTGEAGVVELELLQSQQIKIVFDSNYQLKIELCT